MNTRRTTFEREPIGGLRKTKKADISRKSSISVIQAVKTAQKSTVTMKT
jgi:hypothetical protein